MDDFFAQGCQIGLIGGGGGEGMRPHSWCGVRGKELHLIFNTNIALLVLGTQMSPSTDNIDDNHASIISPTGTHDNAGMVHQDLAACLLFNEAAPDIPTQHICPLTREPPFDPVHFDGPVASGTITNVQV